MRPVVDLQLVENESKDKIYAEENKVLTLRLVNSRPWNEEKQLENYKVGVSLHGKKVEISYGQMRACEILYKVSVEVPPKKLVEKNLDEFLDDWDNDNDDDSSSEVEEEVAQQHSKQGTEEAGVVGSGEEEDDTRPRRNAAAVENEERGEEIQVDSTARAMPSKNALESFNVEETRPWRELL